MCVYFATVVHSSLVYVSFMLISTFRQKSQFIFILIQMAF